MYNPNANPWISADGIWTDDRLTPKKIPNPDAEIIDANGYVVFTKRISIPLPEWE